MAKYNFDTKGIAKEDLDRIERFRLMDDDFMSKCFEDNIECTELVVNIILGRDDIDVKEVHTQYLMKNLQGRSIILDIYAVDRTGKRYNIEIQRSDRGAGSHRARYNAGVIDANVSAAGEAYEELAEVYVIFITERDVFGDGLPIYHIERTIKETGKDFNDGSHIIYVNGEYKDDSTLGILMQDFYCTDPDDMRYKELADRARHFKRSEEGVRSMCRMLEEMREEVAEKTAKENTAQIIYRLVSDGKFSEDEAKAYFKLTDDDLKKIMQIS